MTFWPSCCIFQPKFSSSVKGHSRCLQDKTGQADWRTVFYLKAHPPSSSIHLSVMGCCLATLHIVLTSSHNSTKVTVAAKSVISMSLNTYTQRKCQDWVTLSKRSRNQDMLQGVSRLNNKMRNSFTIIEFRVNSTIDWYCRLQTSRLTPEILVD